MQNLLEVVKDVIENGSYDRQWIYARSCEPSAEAMIGVELSGWEKIATLETVIDAVTSIYGDNTDGFSAKEVASAVIEHIACRNW